MILCDEEGSLVRLVAVGEPASVRDFNGLPLVLRQPIFFCPHARLAAAQRKPQPVLFLTASDWAAIRRPRITHAGAFGRDSEAWTAQKVRARFAPGSSSYDPTRVTAAAAAGPAKATEVAGAADWVRHADGGDVRSFYRLPGDDGSMTLVAPQWPWAVVREKEETASAGDAAWFDARWAQLRAAPPEGWVAVWKFPRDLNRLPGFTRIERVPLPVGLYPFADDRWWAPRQPAARLPELPIDDCEVEKLRSDLPSGRSVHHLQAPDRGGAAVAMLSSTYFIGGYWEEDPVAQRPELVGLLQDLHRLGIHAFACYSQHHAIVFYADLAGTVATDSSVGGGQMPMLLSPQRFARLLADEVRGPPVVAALQKAALPERAASIAMWRDDYVQAYDETAAATTEMGEG